MKNKITKKFITTFLMLFMALSFIPAITFAATEINKVEFSMKDYYNAGDRPEATAHGFGESEDYYDVDYEYWVEKGTAKIWYSDESKNEGLAENRRITTFEDGKTYLYSIYLKAKEGYTFADNKEVYVNGEKVGLVTLDDTKTTMMLLAIKEITPTVYQEKYIDEVEINNATISFKAGDKPIFTGKVSDNAPYVLRDESWVADGDNKEHHSGSMWNDNNPDKLFNTFESGKTYTYGIYFISYDYKGYFFTRDTKLKINGKYYNYRESEWESQPDVNKFSTMWITTNLTMTPTENSQGTPTTPSESEKPSQEPATPSEPEKSSQEPATSTQETENKTEQTNNPKTGDTSNIFVWYSLFAASALAMLGIIVYNKKKKSIV